MLNTDVKQEITLCYCDPLYDISMRGWELMHYGFECQCNACTDLDNPHSFGAASRERRWKMRELDMKLRMAVMKETEKLGIRLELVGLLKEEGLCNVLMASTYLDIARGCEQGGDVIMAVKAAKKALEIFTICCGADHELSENAAKSVRAFEKQLPR